MKISRLEFVTILLAAVFLGFAAGWFLRGNSAAQSVRVETGRALAPEQAVLAPATPAPTPTPSPDPLADGAKIDINTADRDTLMALPGIGEKRAQDIIDDRQANGPFRIPEDITRVKGIGEGTLAGIIEWITVGEEAQ